MEHTWAAPVETITADYARHEEAVGLFSLPIPQSYFVGYL